MAFANFVLNSRLGCRAPLKLFLTGAFCTASMLGQAQVIGWGNDRFGELSPSDQATRGFQKIYAGNAHTFGIKRDGTVVAFGSTLADLSAHAALTGVVGGSGANSGSVLVLNDGTLTSCGTGSFGELSPPSGLTNVKKVSGLLYVTLALKQDGSVVAWGTSGFGQTSIPSGLTSAIDVHPGVATCVAVKSDGTVVAWGDTSQRVTRIPAGLNNVKQAVAGNGFAIALKNDGSLVSWGDQASANAPLASGQTGIAKIVTSRTFAVALKTDGTVVNLSGVSNYNPPSTVSGIVDIAATAFGVIALKAAPADDDYTAPAGQVLTGNVMDNDWGTLGFSASLISQPTHGTVALNADGSFTYTPNSYFAGDDTFTYRNLGPNFDTGIGTVTVHLSPLSLQTPSLDLSTVVGGQYVRGTLSLTSGTAPTGGLPISLSYGSGLTGPASVTIPEGESSVRFRALSDTVDSNVLTSVNAQLGSSSVQAQVTITPASLASVVVNPGSVYGGKRAYGTVRLNGQAGPSGLVVALASGNPYVSVPSSVTIPSGKSSAPFLVFTSPIPSDTDVQITAGGSATATVRVQASRFSSLTLSHASAPGGARVVGTLRLTSPAPDGGYTIIGTSSTRAASVPFRLAIPAGAISRTFEVKTTPVDSDVTATIAATLSTSSGVVQQQSSLTVCAAKLVGVFPNPASWKGGKSASLAVRFDGATGSAGAVVSLSSSDPLITVPATVTLGAGATRKVFTVTSRRVTTPTQVTLTAVCNGVTKQVVVTLNP